MQFIGSFENAILAQCIVEEHLIFSVPTIGRVLPRQIIEIVLPELQVEKHTIGNLSIQLQARSAQADVKGFSSRIAQHCSARVTLVIAKPDLVEDRCLDVVASVLV